MDDKGVFKGIFTVLSAIIGLFGIGMLWMSGRFTPWSAGAGVATDALILGALFLVMGVGFLTFGVMIGREGWDAPSN